MSPEIHLPETVLCVNIPLRAKEIIAVLSIYMRNAKLIANNFNGTMQPGNVYVTGSFREGSPNRENNECGNDEDQTN